MNEFKKHPNCEVEVITTSPNRYLSFSVDAQAFEKEDNITINRVALPSHKSGMLDQVNAFLTYYRETQKIVANNDYDIVFATSSRLFTAFLAARIANAKRIPLYLDIRDIFVDTIKDILPTKVSLFAKPIFTFIEKYTFKRAQRINLVSKGFKEYFQTRYPHVDYRWYTNGIDSEFLAVKPINSEDISTSDLITVLYAGNIGEGQGLEKILPDLAKSLTGQVEFIVIGDGGGKTKLEHVLAKEKVANVRLLAPMNRRELIASYQSADVLFLHLNDYPAFKKVLPSKIFEYAAMGKPMLAGVSGFSADFIHSEVDNAAVFQPNDHLDAKQKLDSLDLVNTRRDDFIKKYSRENIMSVMVADIIEFAEHGKKW
jgi:glycosyltransferase involved in cell wall biosynthesis